MSVYEFAHEGSAWSSLGLWGTGAPIHCQFDITELLVKSSFTLAQATRLVNPRLFLEYAFTILVVPQCDIWSLTQPQCSALFVKMCCRE